MWEMIAGNNGNRDECINISMDKALFPRLQSKVTVFKKILDSTSQATDKSFVYIASFESKEGAYSVYGFNSRLENDGRGGDYSSFVAVKANEECAEIKLEDIYFLDENGFAKYAYEKYNSSDFDGFVAANKDSRENRFAMSAIPVEMTDGAKKRIVNAIMCAFSRKKGESVAFCFDEADIDAFNKKAIYVLLEVIKYIPYALRKDIGFLSNVRTKGKVSELINLAAYPQSFGDKPRNCIELLSEDGISEQDAFFAYTEKVFAMDDGTREAYFETLKKEIEEPSRENGFDIKSDFYDLDTETKPLWTNGDATEAIADIFASVDNVLKVYPAYLELAKERLAREQETVLAYVKNVILNAEDTTGLKSAYNDFKVIFELCGLNFELIIGMTTLRGAKLIADTQTDLGIAGVADDLMAINPDMFALEIEGRKLLCGEIDKKLRELIRAKGSLESVYDLYALFKEKAYVNVNTLSADVCQRVEELIHEETDAVEAGKDKLNRLEQIYRTFTAVYGEDCEPVCNVYKVYFDRYSRASAGQAFEHDLKLFEEIEKQIRDCADENWFNFFISKITELTNLESEDGEVKEKASRIYARLTENLYRVIRDTEKISYGTLCELCENAGPRVDTLKRKGIHDAELRNMPPQGELPVGGAYRFITLLDNLIKELGENKKLAEAIVTYDKIYRSIFDEEFDAKPIFEKAAGVVIEHWIGTNKVKISVKKVDAAVAKIKNNVDIKDPSAKLFSRIAEAVAQEELRLAELKREKRANSPVMKLLRNKWTWIISGAVVILAGLITCAIILIPKMFAQTDAAENKPQSETNSQVEDTTKYIAAQAELDEVDAYLNGFGDGYKDAGIVLGKLEKAEDGSGYTVTADNTLMINEGIAEPIKATLELADAGKSKFVAESVIKPESAYIVVVANKDGASVLLDVYEFSGDLAKYDYKAAESAAQLPDGVDKVFFQKLIRYVGVKCGYVMTEAQAAESKKEEKTEIPAEPANGENAQPAENSEKVGTDTTSSDAIINPEESTSKGNANVEKENKEETSQNSGGNSDGGNTGTTAPGTRQGGEN